MSPRRCVYTGAVQSLVRGEIHPTALISKDAHIGAGVTIGAFTIVNPNVVIGDRSVIGPHCLLGEVHSSFYSSTEYDSAQLGIGGELRIGGDSLIRSHSVLYAGSTIGHHFSTGHRVTVRESVTIGSNTRLGTRSELLGNATIGDYVSIHSNVFIASRARIEDFAWLFPGVVLTDDPHPPSERLAGVTICEFAAVAAAAVLLPGVTIGRHALVGAASLVRSDVADEAVVVGNPARQVGTVREIRDRTTGEPVYPWPEHFSRGMPWAGTTFAAWCARQP